MTRAPVLFRVDAGPRQGWESYWRCMIYAAALQRRRRSAHFLSRIEPFSLLQGLKRAGNEWIQAREVAGTREDLEDTLREVRRLRPAALVIDSPSTEEIYLDAMRSEGVAVVAMDSVASTAFSSHLLVNPLLGPSREGYEIRQGTQVLLGARYALIRPEIRRVRPLRSQEPAQPFRVIVALGDDDLPNQSAEMARNLLNCPRVGRVDVLVRPYHPDLENLKAMAAECPDRLEIASEANEYPLRISRCHLAITAGNSWSLELACVGVPQLVVVQSEMHWPTAHRLEESGAAMCLGSHSTLAGTTFRQAVGNLLSDPLERQAMARAGRKLIDGRGPDRLVTALEIVLNPMQRQLGTMPIAA